VPRTKKSTFGTASSGEEGFGVTLHDELAGVLAFNREGLLIFWNTAMERMTGLSREAVLGHAILEVLPALGEALEEDPATDRTLIVGPRRCLVPELGREAFLDIVALPVRDAAGQITGRIAIVRDTADRRRAHEALRRLEQAVEHMQIGVTITSLDGRILYTNAAEAEMHGYAAGELIGKEAHIMAPPSHRKPLSVEQLKRLTRWKRETPNVRKDGSQFPGHLMSDVLKDEEGNPIGIVTTCEDLTERKTLEEQLRGAQKMEAIGRLAGGVAHDFNNLLTAITGYSELVTAQLEESSPLRADIAEILRAGERAAALTRQLLAFSRRQMLHPEILDLNTVISNLEKMLRRLIGEHITLATDLETGVWPVRADPGQIEQVIMNLAINAGDAMPRGGTLTIATRNFEVERSYGREQVMVQRGRYVSLEVIDTGIGMDEATRARIFEPFFTTKGLGKGTGLGLATVYGIVKQSGGYIWVESELGRGTRFRIDLPRASGGKTLSHPATRKTPAPAGRETILVVEDEDAVRDLARRVLQHSGYTVFEARNGKEALALAAEHRGTIDLLLTDVVMPGMSGPDLAAEMVRQRPSVKVLYISGYTAETLAAHGDLNAANLLPKPFTGDALTRRIREALNR
jgi:two-component system, cell cycle sensor histidine kinase and response regulator CckA